jgi:hypothetical protein
MVLKRKGNLHLKQTSPIYRKQEGAKNRSKTERFIMSWANAALWKMH